MCSYNALNGVPTCGNEPLLNGILRDQWGWDGFVVSDYDAWAQIRDTHGYCPTYECAAAVGLKAGMDQEGGGTAAVTTIPSVIAAGNLTLATVQQSARRLFRVRMQLGMLDPPTLNPWNTVDNGTDNVLSAAHLALARQAALESIALYQNRGNVLPLQASALTSIAVIGPQAVNGPMMLGNYADTPDIGVPTILEAVSAAMGQPLTYNCTTETNVDYYVPGESGTSSPSPEDCCAQCTVDPTCQYFTWFLFSCYKKANATGRVASDGRVSGQCLSKPPSTGKVRFAPGCNDPACADTSGFPTAVATAQSASATLMILGLDQSIESEGYDRATIELPTNQLVLLSQVRAATAGKPLIVVLIHGGTLALGNVSTLADGILDAWYPGMEGASAIATVVFGGYSPAGRASVTSYLSTAQLPPMGDMNLYPHNGSQGITYRYFEGPVMYPFGFGLSYTTFAYSALTTNVSSAGPCDTIGVTVQVQNTGKVDSDEVVQLYAKQPDATVPVPRVRLVDFARVTVAAGQTVSVSLVVRPETHPVVYDGPDVYNATVAVEAGRLQLYVGGGQPDFYPAHLNTTVLITQTKPLTQC